MSKPEWCPPDVWATAGDEALKYVEWLVPTPSDADAEHVLSVSFARTILAERQAIEDLVREVLREEITDGKIAINGARAILGVIRGVTL